jgi:hypothetical protein
MSRQTLVSWKEALEIAEIGTILLLKRTLLHFRSVARSRRDTYAKEKLVNRDLVPRVQPHTLRILSCGSRARTTQEAQSST